MTERVFGSVGYSAAQRKYADSRPLAGEREVIRTTMAYWAARVMTNAVLSGGLESDMYERVRLSWLGFECSI